MNKVMILTGRCKEDFEKWVISNGILEMSLGRLSLRCSIMLTDFYNLPKSMQYAIYIDFFDVNKIVIELQPILELKMSGNIVHGYRYYINGYVQDNIILKTRQEAKEKSIGKAIDLYNNNIKDV